MPDLSTRPRVKKTAHGTLRQAAFLSCWILGLVAAACTSKRGGNTPPPGGEAFQKAEQASQAISVDMERKRSASREKTPQELESIEESNRDQAVRKYRSVLAGGGQLSPEVREASLVNLGHVLFEQCLSDYRKRMRAYEEAYAAYQRGDAPQEPVLPRYDFSPAREVYQEFLKAFPSSPMKPQVLYNMAFSHEEEGDLDRAVSLYDELTLTAPASRFSPEAYMRLGEHFFELDRFDTAIEHYRKVMDLGDSPFYDKALFKTGWALYAQGDFPGAEKAFAQLLQRQSALEGEKKKDLYGEGLEILAKIQSETGGAKALDSFLERYENPPYGLDLSLQLGNYFQETSRYEDAVETYRKLLDRYPNCARAPFVEQSLIECLKTERRLPEAEKLQASLLDRYGRGTPWAQQNPDPELRREVDALLWSTLNNEILAHHRLARESKDPAEYAKTIALYQTSLGYFPLDENTYETRFRYAEALFESGRLQEAAREYERIAKMEPYDTYREKAASKRIQCLEELRAREQVDMDTLLAAYDDYATMNPQSEKTPLLRFKQGETLFNASRYDEAAGRFNQIIQEYPGHPDTVRAWILELESLFHAGRYPELETFADGLLKANLALTEAQRDRAEHLLRFAQFEKARAAQEAGRYAEAAAIYEKLVREAPGIEIAPDALFNAAVCYKALGDWSGASACFESITTRYPASKHYADSLLAPLAYYEETGQWDRILAVLDKLYAQDPKNELARETLFKLGKRFHKKGQTESAQAAFALYGQRYPNDLSGNMEILYLQAELLHEKGDLRAERQAYQRFLDIYAKASRKGAAVAVEPASVAKAQFMVLEPVFQEYQSIQLVPPLQRNLARKQTLLDQVVSEYLTTAKSGAGPYAVAAAFRVGLAYEDFWKSLLGSDVPGGMTAEEAAVYRDLLEKQAAPYREKAVAAYRVTLEKTEGKGVLNPWILRAYGHLAGLDPVDYPPLLRDTLLWNESYSEKRIMLWEVDRSRPRGFSPAKAAELEQEMGSVLRGLQEESSDPAADRARIEQAVTRLERLLKKAPDLYEAHFNLGILHHTLDEPRRAKTEYLLALQQNPQLPVAQLNLGILYLQDEEWKNAENAFLAMTRLSPDYAGAWYLLGVARNRQGRHADAEPALKKAVAQLPQFLDPYVELGLCYQNTGNAREARKSFETVLNNPNTNARLLRKLGWGFLEAGYPEDAIACYNRIAQLKQDSAEDWNNLGVAYLRAGKLRPAETALARAERLKPDRAEPINNLGLVYLREKEYDKAADSFQRASVLAHKYLAPLLNQAVLYGEYLEDAERAADAIRKSLALGGTVQKEMLHGWVRQPQPAGPGT